MAKRRVLASWIGHTDLRAMAPSMPKEVQARIAEIAGPQSALKDGLGPVKTLLTQERFHRVHVLSNYPDDLNRCVQEWLGGVDTTIHAVGLDDPTDYGSIFVKVEAELRRLTDEFASDDFELAILLSPVGFRGRHT